jgi:pre-mRNA-processing factor 8
MDELTSSPGPASSQSAPASSIPEEALPQLRSDAELMRVVGLPVVPEEPIGANSLLDDEEEELIMDMIDTVSEDEGEEDDCETENTFEETDEKPNEEIEGLDRGRTHRLQTGLRAYGDLQHEEQEHLLDQIVDRPDPASGVNTLLRALDELELRVSATTTGPETDKKHIPSVYMKNSRSVRLAVLAGLIDSDGWYVYPKNMLGFAQSERWHSVLFWDTVALARSLGLSVWTKRRMMWNPKRTQRFPQLFAQIFGNVAEVPCLLMRKKGVERLIPQAHSFIVKDISLETEAMEWAGFRVDQDQLYLRHDYLVLHNSGFEEVSFLFSYSRLFKSNEDLLPNHSLLQNQ